MHRLLTRCPALCAYQMTVLDEALTVLDMTTKAWDAQSELVLYFRLKPSSGGSGARA